MALSNINDPHTNYKYACYWFKLWQGYDPFMDKVNANQ